MAIAGVAVWQGTRPAGFGLDWLGPEWLANLVSFGVFLIFATWFVRRIRN